LATLARAAKNCQACPLWRTGTQTVFGDGIRAARVIAIGEQPGDQEDRIGRPFVGPAGRLLDRALIAADIDRRLVYVTNAVKHFKWEPRGPRRLHKKPSAREVAACRPWLLAEIEAVQPRLLVCLGATAAQSVLQRPVRVLQERGRIQECELGPSVLITLHPSALLRIRDRAEAHAAFEQFVEDLRPVAEHLRHG
jgi:DNA polymerase